MYTKPAQSNLKNIFFVSSFLSFLVVSIFILSFSVRNSSDVKTGLAAIPGDCDGDGFVDLFDYGYLSRSFGLIQGQPGFDGRCDFHVDQFNIIDLFDYQILANNFGRTGATNTPTPRSSITPTSPPPTGVDCNSLSGIERRFPCRTLVVGPMPEHVTSGTDAWDMFSNDLYPGVTNGVNERFSAVANPTGSGVVIRNQNLLSDAEGHTTLGTGRSLPIGTTECSAFRWLWKNQTEFQQRGWVLIWQLQMSGSPIVAIEVDQSTGDWAFRNRNGSDTGIETRLTPVVFGRWTYFVVCTHLAEAPGGWTKVWFRHDTWPDVNTSPFYQRSGHDTYQGTTGHNTIGIYAGRVNSPVSYYGYFDRYGRATTPQRAVQLAGNP